MIYVFLVLPRASGILKNNSLKNYFLDRNAAFSQGLIHAKKPAVWLAFCNFGYLGGLEGLCDAKPELRADVLAQGLGIIQPQRGPFHKTEKNRVQTQAHAQRVRNRTG